MRHSIKRFTIQVASISLVSTLFVSSNLFAQPKDPGTTYEELKPDEKTPPNNDDEKTPNKTTKLPEENDGLYLNAVDTDIKELIKQIAKATGKNFLIGNDVRGKVTIISERKMSLDEAYQAFLSALEVNGYTVVAGPGGLTKIVTLKDALQNPLPIYREDSPVTDAFITRIIQMHNISALDMSAVVKPLVGKRGNLFAYPSTNTLIVTDTGSNIDRILGIVKELDQEGPQEGLEFISIRNASAKEVAARISELYPPTQQSKSSSRSRRGRVEFDEAPLISKVIADDRTNSIIVLGSKRAMEKVRALIAQLDRQLPDGVEGKVHVHYLKHANAKDMAAVLSSVTQGSSSSSSNSKSKTPGKQTAQSTGTVVASFEGGVKVAADENSNALVITATAKDYETMRKQVIDKLDIPRRQVYVEAIIMELAINKTQSVGISGQGGGLFNLGGESTLGFGSTLGGTSSGLSAAALSGLAAGIVSERTVNIPVTQSDGTISNVSVPSFGIVLNALSTNTDVNVLSTPNLLTLDNEEAEIVVGNEVPVPTSTTLTPGGNSTFSTERKNVGIILKITPQINEGDRVRLKIKQEITGVVPGASDAILTSVGPTFSKRSVETVVVAKDQQTIVIGGLIDDKATVGTSKVPILGDIPLLGMLFKRKNKTKEKTNILVFLRPYIIRNSNDFLKILQKKVEERNMFIEQNYGRSHKRVIQNSIRNHAAELLDFKKDVQKQNYDVLPRHKYQEQGSAEDLSLNNDPYYDKAVKSNQKKKKWLGNRSNKKKNSKQASLNETDLVVE